MPCNTDGMERDQGWPSQTEQELDRITQFLCDHCKRHPPDPIEQEQLSLWWEKHREVDLRQELRSKRREAGLEKLSPEEREALGIDED